jgi:hypothetical protein
VMAHVMLNCISIILGIQFGTATNTALICPVIPVSKSTDDVVRFDMDKCELAMERRTRSSR